MRAAKAIEEELEKIAEGKLDPEKWLDDVFEIQRVQSLVGSKWETRGYYFTVAVGGPSIVVNSLEDKIELYWAPKHYDYHLNSLAREGLRQVEGYLDELWLE